MDAAGSGVAGLLVVLPATAAWPPVCATANEAPPTSSALTIIRLFRVVIETSNAGGGGLTSVATIGSGNWANLSTEKSLAADDYLTTSEKVESFLWTKSISYAVYNVTAEQIRNVTAAIRHMY